MNSLNRTLVAIATVAAAALSASAFAQYAGPGSAPATYRNVADVLDKGTDDSRVELEGFLIQQVGKEKYIFSDGQSQIRVEIESEDFPQVKIDEKVKVRIRGEVEKDFMQSAEIDVDHITVVN